MVKELTHFEKRVYTVVKKIPSGKVKTYAWVAEKAGRLGAARAVGNVLSRNIFPLIVPCHRGSEFNWRYRRICIRARFKKKIIGDRVCFQR